MKELKSHIKEEISVHAQKQEERQKSFMGSFTPQPGQKVWQIDLRTQEITPAEYSEEFANIDGSITRNIIRKELFWYCCALNKKNAMKRFNKMAQKVLTNIHQHD